jgi:plastocyanin
MRRHRALILPLAFLPALVAAAPASAASWDVEVVDFEFKPKTRAIAVGDSVIWRFAAEGHTTTAAPGQAQRWDSGPATTPRGETFERTFRRPGRFQYFCTPHQGLMRGTITVGKDNVRDTFDAFKTTPQGTGATISFRLNEPAKMTYKLRGPSDRTVKRRLARGSHKFSLKGLEAGSYRGTLTLQDDFDKKASAKKPFAIG